MDLFSFRSPPEDFVYRKIRYIIVYIYIYIYTLIYNFNIGIYGFIVMFSLKAKLGKWRGVFTIIQKKMLSISRREVVIRSLNNTVFYEGYK